MAHKTNEQLFKALFKDLDTLEVALLRERVMFIINATEKEVKAKPMAFQGLMWTPNMFLNLCAKVKKHLGFEDESSPPSSPL